MKIWLALLFVFLLPLQADAYMIARDSMDRAEQKNLAQRYLKHWEVGCSQIPALSSRDEEYLRREYDEILDQRPFTDALIARQLRAGDSEAYAIRNANQVCTGVRRHLKAIISGNLEERNWLALAWIYTQPSLLEGFRALVDRGLLGKFSCDNRETDTQQIKVCENVINNQGRAILTAFIMPLLSD